jgi:hypothetical protein
MPDELSSQEHFHAALIANAAKCQPCAEREMTRAMLRDLIALHEQGAAMARALLPTARA